jgi:glycerol uptake facilitator protein
MSSKGDYGAIPHQEPSDRPTNSNRGGLPELKALVAEFFGTATLVQVGCGANCVATYLGALEGMWQVASMWTLAGMVGIYLSAAQSGGHLNPAVTLAFALVRRDDFPMQSVVPYWIAQLLGAFTGAMINLMLFTTSIAAFEADLGEDESLLTSAAAFGDYWRYA